MAASITILSGGPLGGMEVDQSDWPVGSEREFGEDADRVAIPIALYRNDEGDHAVFVGMKDG